jgi:hypothetical protein
MSGKRLSGGWTQRTTGGGGYNDVFASSTVKEEDKRSEKHS